MIYYFIKWQKFHVHSESNKIFFFQQVPVERRTLPTDLPGTSHRRPFQKRGSQSPKDENAHVSCSLPETPIFARGCDIPRTPLRSTTDKANTSRPASRLNGGFY